MNNNTAIRKLMDDPLMIGRHRPLVAKWFQSWVDEYTSSKKVSETADYELVAMDLKAELLKQIEESFAVTVEKVCLNEGWRKGTPYPDDAKIGKEITVKFYGFRENAKD